MGSHATQGAGISVFLLSFLFLALAFAGGGLIALLAFAVLFGASVVLLRKCRAMDVAGAE